MMPSLPLNLNLAKASAALAAAVFVAAAGSIWLTRDYTEIAAVWIANALVLATILQHDKARWPLLLATAYVAYALANLVMNNGWIIAVFASGANIAEILICAFVLTRRDSPRFDAVAPGDFVRLVIGSTVGAACSAFIATVSISFHNDVAPVDLFVSWFVSDGLGLLIFTPSFAILQSAAGHTFWRGGRRNELLIWPVFVGGALLVFGQHAVDLLPLAPMLLIAVAFGFDTARAAFAITLFSIIAIAATALDLGPVATNYADTTTRLRYLQAFLALVALICTPVAIALSQRRELSRRLAGHNREWSALAEASRDIVVRADPEGIVRYVSPACRMLGIAPEDMIGRPILEFMAPEDRERAARAVRDCVNRAYLDSSANHEFRAVSADGSRIWLEGNPQLVRDQRGKAVEFVTSFRDITARRALQAELEQSQRELAAIANSMRDVMVRYAPDTTMTYLSPACEAVLGYAPEELIGRRMLDFIHPDDVQRGGKQLSSIVKAGPDGPVINMRLRARHKDGRWITMEGRPRALFNASNGEPTVFYDVMRDVTEQVEAEAALKAARDVAERATKAKSDFVANMSHELRTPLNSVIGYSRLLARSEALNERDRRYAHLVDNASEATLAIVNDILDSAALERGALSLREGPVSLHNLLKGAAALVAAEADLNDLEVRVDFDPNIASTLLGDRGRLRQVLLNLASNAVKFTKVGTVTLRAVLEADEPDAQRLLLEVRDSGSGIAAEHRELIFERFVQVGERAGGSGLGLSIVKQLVELMGGTITLESDPSWGSNFSVSLTLAKALAEAEPADAASVHLPSQRILVVDDVDLNRELAATILAKQGHTVETAGGGAEAVARCRETQFDLVFMDVRMPGMNGLEAARAIRAMHGASAQAPIVALTAGIRAEKIAACLAAGMNGCIAKPIHERELLQALAAWTTAPKPVPGADDGVGHELRARFRERLALDRDMMAAVNGGAGLKELVHRMAGSAGSFGFDEIGARACMLDEILTQGGPGADEALTALLRAIDTELEPRAA